MTTINFRTGNLGWLVYRLINWEETCLQLFTRKSIKPVIQRNPKLYNLTGDDPIPIVIVQSEISSAICAYRLTIIAHQTLHTSKQIANERQ